MKTTVHLLLIGLLVFTAVTEAREREKPLRPGRGHRRGNENSQPVSQVNIGNPNYGGNGCPAGTMRVVFAPDNLSFSLLFDQFVAEVSTPAMANRDVMACDTIIPMQIPDGMQMQITRVDFRGFAALPDRARGSLHSVFNFRGGQGDGNRMNLRFNFMGPLMENYELSSDSMAPGEVVSSPCGGSFNLRIKNQLNVRAPKRGESASITLDSVDGSSEAIYFMNWQACERARARARR